MEHDDEAQLRREMGQRFQRARKNARNGLGFRQGEVAAALGKGLGTVSTWETGRALPDPFILRWMALNYGVSVDELLVLKEPAGKPEPPLPQQPAPIPAVPQKAQRPCVECPDTIELPMSALVRVIQHAVASGLTDEREVRAFLNGVVAGSHISESPEKPNDMDSGR
jgi:transcriptional regulator with XRE-family HTH domain